MRRFACAMIICCTALVSLGGCAAKRPPRVTIEPTYSFVRDRQAFLREHHASLEQNKQERGAMASTDRP